MRREKQFKRNYAVAEVIGGILLVAVAVVAFSAVYMYLYPPDPEVNCNVKIEGFVTDEGDVVLKHVGGEIIDSYKIIVRYPNGSQIGIKEFDAEPWSFSEEIYPLEGLTGIKLTNYSTKVEIIVYNTDRESDQGQIFNAVLCGKTTSSQEYLEEDSMLISSLKTNSPDEDLLCFTNLIDLGPYESNISSFIFNWIVNDNPITDLMMPFDLNRTYLIKDYSGKENNGSAYGPIWNSGGKVGGAYEFDGEDDYITIPYCYDGDYIGEITIETWIKTTGDAVTLASFDKEKYWDLAIEDGKVKWSIASDQNMSEISSISNVNDGFWHYIAINYDFSTGVTSIYIDGIFDTSLAVFNPGDVIGDGSRPEGSIGLGKSSSEEEIIFQTSFETQSERNKWNFDYQRSQRYAYLRRFLSDSLSPRSGSFSLGGSGDIDPYFTAYDRDSIDISNYDDVQVSVYYSYKSTECSDGLGFYYKDGGDYIPIFEENCPNVGNDNQLLPWEEAEASIPNHINDLILEFRWSSSHSREYLAIDDLTVTGSSEIGYGNYSGFIDEFKIYNRALSEGQIYQNYLLMNSSISNYSMIISEETSAGQSWSCNVTPNDTEIDHLTVESNTIQIENYPGGDP